MIRVTYIGKSKKESQDFDADYWRTDYNGNLDIIDLHSDMRNYPNGRTIATFPVYLYVELIDD